VIFKHVDLEVTSGECVAIVGDNGAGKTTLLRSLAGMLRPTSGTVQWFGHTDGRSQHLRAVLGYVGHEPQVYPYLTVYENLLFAARMHAVVQPKHRVHDLLSAMGISHLANALAAKVSRGIRQRLDIARATVHSPSILLLDEPLNSLDQGGRQWLMNLLASNQQQQQTVCFTTHHGQPIRRLADRVLHVNAGSVLELPPDECDAWHAAA
jgi:heme ABC exporter ATP-binding subunit CcmA